MSVVRRDVQLNVPTQDDGNYFSKLSPGKNTLSVVLRTYKGAVTQWCRNNDLAHFQWQSRFHDHIIRNEDELNRIREYIANNPLRWAGDAENPASNTKEI